MSSYVENELAVPERRKLRALEIAYTAFLLVAVGRIGELVPGLGSLPLAKMAMAVGLTLLIVNWKHLPQLSPVTRPFVRTALGLTAIAILSVLFSIWPGQSFVFVYAQLPVLAAAMVFCWKLSYSWAALRGIIRILVLSAVLLAAVALLGFRGGRAVMGGSLDANDLAYVLVSIAPLALAFALTAKTRMKRIVNMGICGLLVVATLLTSSRGGFFGLIAVIAVLVVLPVKRPQPQEGGRSGNRIILPALGVLFASMLLWPYLPAETRDRLATVVQLDNDYNLDPTNKNGRSAIWERGIHAALQRPIGYGVQSYPMVDMRMGGQFRAPHNSYLEVLVELGVLGLLLFLRMYLLSWRTLQRLRAGLLAAAPSEERDEILIFARMLQVTLVGNAIAAFFLSMSYSSLLWTLFAVVITCASLVADYLPAATTDSPAQTD